MEPRGLGHPGGSLGERSRKHTPGRRRAQRRRLAVVVGTLLAAAGPALPTQEPATRAALEQFRDSLAGVTDTAALTAAARTGTDGLAPAAAAAARLRQGFIQLRVAQLGNPYRYRSAESAFDAATRLEPGWPYPRYGRGLAKFGLSEAQRAQSRELGLYVGVGALDDAVTALTDALAIEPTFAPALATLDQVVERLHRADLWEKALVALRRGGAAAGGLPNADALLGLGRIEREVGSVDSALAAFDAYLATGGLPGLGRLELARTQLAHGLPGGEAAYYAGAAYDDSLTVEGYRNDIAVILTDSQLVAFDLVRGADRVEYLRRFWGDRDRLELRRPGERLAEHYRRLDYARKHFALPVTRRVYAIGCDYRTGSMDFDDRGVIYIRQGEPTRRITTYLFDMMPNESWRYDRADGNLIFHFGSGIGTEDYRVLSSVLDIYGRCTVLPIPTDVPVAEVYSSRAAIDPMYARLAMWGGTIAGAQLAREEQRIGQASVAIALGTDAYERHFARPLGAAISISAVGQAGPSSLVHIVYGIPGAHLTGTEENGETSYPVSLRFAAFDGANHVVASADTTVVLTTAAPVSAGAMLFGRFAVAVPPGQWHYRLSLQQGDSSGVVTPRDSLVVRRYDTGLSRSDPVLGWRAVGLTWARGADTVFFSPFRSYFDATELELYYEVYGLAPGAPYQAELVVSEKRGTKRTKPGVRISYRGVASGPVTSGRRTIDLRRFKPGAYWLDLIVTDAAGRRDQRRTWFEVRRGAGAAE